jgi:hypothetical protein
MNATAAPSPVITGAATTVARPAAPTTSIIPGIF